MSKINFDCGSMYIFKYFESPIHQLTIIALLLIFTTASPSFAQTYTHQQVLSDINALVKTLRKTHPNLYAHRTKKEFNSIVKSVRENVKIGGNYYSILPHFQKILAATCDEHTRIILRNPFINGKMKLSDFTSNEPAIREYLNSRFLKSDLVLTTDQIYMDNPAISFNRQTLHNLNGNGVERIQKLARSIASVDGCFEDGILLTRLLPISHRVILSSLLQVSNHHPISVKSADDEHIRNYSGSAASMQDLMFVNPLEASIASKIDHLKQIGIKLKKSDFLDSRNPIHGILVKSNPDKSVYYIYSRTFHGDDKQTKRTNKLLRAMISSKPKHVLLDLTDNPGGKIRAASHLLSYFLDRSHAVAARVRMLNPSAKTPANFTYHSKQHKKSHQHSKRIFRKVRKKRGHYSVPYRKGSFGNPDFKGKLSVLVSPRTHSAATAVASVLKRQRGAKLIGYLNAGNTKTSCFAASGYFTLPATGIKVAIPDTCFDRPKNKFQKGKILDLDISVDPLGSATSILSARILKAGIDDIAK